MSLLLALLLEAFAAADTDTATISEAQLAEALGVAVDALVFSEAISGTLDASLTDTAVLAESATAFAAITASDSAVFSEEALAGQPVDHVVASDSAVLSEIEALLAEVSATDVFTVTDTWNEPPAPLPPDVREAAREFGATEFLESEAPDEDEELALAGYVSWYH